MADEALVEMPSELLANYARRIGIDPTNYQRGELIDKFKSQTEDYKTVLGLKKAKQDNQQFNTEWSQTQKAMKMQQSAGANRQKYLTYMMGGGK